jgi:hypothetical protein
MRGLRSASSWDVASRFGLPSFHSGVKVTFLMRGEHQNRVEVVAHLRGG